MAAHAHRLRAISHTTDPDLPYVLLACGVDQCVHTERVCVLCQRDGDKRRHRRHVGSKNEAVLDDITWGKAMAYARSAGPGG